MKNFDFKKILPHVVAVFIFLIVSFFYCKPAFDGQVLQQSDISHWKGMAHDGELYAAKHGQPPLWNNTLFGGMPTFQIAYPSNNDLPYFISQTLLTLGLPIPASMFFAACLMFYFLAIVLGVNPWIGIMGAIGYAFSTYNPIIVGVGHNTKMWAIAYLPAALASLLLIFQKRYWIGAALSALFISILINMNHLQITYYFLIIAVLMSIAFAIHWIRHKEWAHLIKSFSFALVAGIIGAAVNAVMLLPNYSYQKATTRGQAPLEMTATKKISQNSGDAGLDWEYATRWSYGKMETITLMVPGFYGGGSSREIMENSAFVQTLSEKGVPEAQAYNIQAGSLYWGPQPGTSGPVYLGAIICFLFIAGLFFEKSIHRWWIVAAALLGILLSWGNNFEGFNRFLFEHLPFYNKFRAPSMALVIPQVVFPVMAMLGLNRMITEGNIAEKLSLFKKSIYACAAVMAIIAAVWITGDFSSQHKTPDASGKPVSVDQVLKNNFTQALGGNEVEASALITKLKEDRKSLAGSDILRSFLLIAAFGVVLFFTIQQRLKSIVAIAVALILCSFDMIGEANNYLNTARYLEPSENEKEFIPSAADLQIQQDKSDYRVLNLAQDVFNDAITAYHHRCVGGYHAAKLRIYQDLIENQIAKMNPAVLDMLNTKYVIQQGPGGQPVVMTRSTALGSAWLVRNIEFIDSYVAVMKSMDRFTPKDTAIVEKSFQSVIKEQPIYDSLARIALKQNDNDVVSYTFSANSPQFAVFSEIYYEDGWKAYIDGKEAPIVRVNYVLRGLSLPAGSHTIEFKFLPNSYLKGRQITAGSQYLLGLLLALGIFMEWFNRRKLSASV